MSSKSEEMITCPDCGKDGEFTIWHSINSQLDPEAKVDMMSGKIFEFVCPHCKSVHNVDYGFLYHQMEDQIMIQYSTTDEDATKGIEIFEEMTNDDMIGGLTIDVDYTYRIVRSQNQLREKVYIFDQGLDDRVIELMKVFMISQLSQSNPELEIEEMFLEMTEAGPESFAIRLRDGHWGSTEFAQDLYDAIQDKFIKDSDDGKKEYMVNIRWAFEKLKEN